MSATEAARRAAWLAERRRHITSTELPALMGVPGAYGSPMGIYLAKAGIATDEAPPEWMEWGARLQRPILEAYADRKGTSIVHADPYDFAVLAEHPILGASLDAWTDEGDESVPVDAKNSNWRNPAEWGDPGSDQIPARYVVQLQVQMAVTNARMADLAVLFGGSSLAIFRVQRDNEIIAAAIDVAERFHATHILTGIPPPIDGSTEWTRFLASRPQRTEELIQADPVAERLFADLAAARRAKDEAEEREAFARNQLAGLIGEKAGMIGRNWRISFRRTKDGATTDWRTVAETLTRRMNEIDPGHDALIATLVDVNTKPKPGSRAFRPTFPQENP